MSKWEYMELKITHDEVEIVDDELHDLIVKRLPPGYALQTNKTNAEPYSRSIA